MLCQVTLTVVVAIRRPAAHPTRQPHVPGKHWGGWWDSSALGEPAVGTCMVLTCYRSRHLELLTHCSGMMCLEHTQRCPGLWFYPPAASIKCRVPPCAFFQTDRGLRARGGLCKPQFPRCEVCFPDKSSPGLFAFSHPALLVNRWWCFVRRSLGCSSGDTASEDFPTWRTCTGSSLEFCGRSVPCSR